MMLFATDEHRQCRDGYSLLRSCLSFVLFARMSSLRENASGQVQWLYSAAATSGAARPGRCEAFTTVKNTDDWASPTDKRGDARLRLAANRPWHFYDR